MASEFFGRQRNPVNTARAPCAVTMLVHCLRRWPSIVPAQGARAVFTGKCRFHTAGCGNKMVVSVTGPRAVNEAQSYRVAPVAFAGLLSFDAGPALSQHWLNVSNYDILLPAFRYA